MQVICPGCQSCFLLPAGVKKGTILRCSVCKKEFPYTGPDVPADAPLDLPSASRQDPAVSPEPAAATEPVKASSLAPQSQSVQEEPSSGRPLDFDQPAPAEDLFHAKGNSGELPVLGAREKKGHGVLWLSLLVLICLAGVAGWYTVPEFRNFLQGCQTSLFGNDSVKPEPAAKSQPDAGSSAKATSQDQKQPPAQPSGQPSEQVAEKPLVLENVSNRFVDNEHMGSILIIEGKVKNKSQAAYGNIILHAALLDKDRKVIDTADQQAGTVLTDFQLKVMTKAEMVKALSEDAGQGGSIGTVNADGSIPFMVLFSSPSENLSAFSVKIGKSEAVQPGEGNAQPAGAVRQAAPVQPVPADKEMGNSQQPKPVADVPQNPVLSAPAPVGTPTPLSPASGQQPSVPQTVPPSVQPTAQ